jgi:hypothetical protein
MKKERHTRCPTSDEDPKAENFRIPSKLLHFQPTKLSNAKLQRAIVIS